MDTLPVKARHITTIDSLRGLAAVMVCVFHLVCTVKGLFVQDIRDFFFFGKYGVQIFFVISGFVIPFSMIASNFRIADFKNFLLRRIIRIEPPYLASIVLFIIYTYARQWVPGTGEVNMIPSWYNVGFHIGYLIPFVEGGKWFTPVYWTLAIEFQYYLLMCLLFPFLMRNQVSRSIVFILTVMVSFCVQSFEFVFIWMPLFFMGIYGALRFFKIVSNTEFLVVLILSAGLIFYHRTVTDMIFGVGTIGLISLFPYFESKVGAFLGKISYSLYLVHAIVGLAFMNFMSRYADTMAMKITIVLAGLLLSIMSSYVFYLLIEKPSIKKSKEF